MWQKLLKILEFGSKNGYFLPAAYDKTVNGPSISLLIVHLANILALFSVTNLVLKDAQAGCISAICYAIISMILYRMRNLDKVKLDLKEGQVELDAEDQGVGPGENDETK